MAVLEDDKTLLESRAKTVLDSLATISRYAIEARERVPGSINATEVLVGSSKGYDTSTLRVQANLDAGLQRRVEQLTILEKEPFIARVVTRSDDGTSRELLITRGTTPSGVDALRGRVASYLSPFGRLAESAPGRVLTMRDPKTRDDVEWELQEVLRVTPERKDGEWDGVDSAFRDEQRRLFIGSLRSLVRSQASKTAPAVDFFAELESVQLEAALVSETHRRRIVERISLRDQAVLDEYQGDVFRQPIEKRLALFGPPGTGKTTTLIRRIAPKRDRSVLSEDELEAYPAETHGQYFHPGNWVMFTPTDLLRGYLKEAFSRQHIAASDERVQTWSQRRRLLGRDVLGVLRSETGGRLTLRDERPLLADVSADKLIAFFEAFDSQFRTDITEGYEKHLRVLDGSDHPQLRQIAGKFRGGRASSMTFDRLFAFTVPPELATATAQLQADIRSQQGSLATPVMNGRADFIGQLSQLLASLKQEARATAEEDEDELDSDATDESPVSDPRAEAIRAFRDALNAKARSVHLGTTLGRSSRPRAIWDWLGAVAPADKLLEPLGRDLILLRALNFLRNTHTNLTRGVVSSFLRFRRQRLRKGVDYVSDAGADFDRNTISDHELDAVLLLMLRNARRLLERPPSRGSDDLPAVLMAVRGEYVTQVVVDEATDFSPLQLACMLELAEPAFRSLFICGDLRQRVTPWGLRSMEQLLWVQPDFEVREIAVGYRQSRQLADLARRVAVLSGGEAPEVTQPEAAEYSEVRPWLGENLATPDLVAPWLADRIRSIEREIRVVPSIAIFVDGEDHIDPVVDALKPLLLDNNQTVAACKQGVVGGDEQVRVFDIRHIKGLEFEAVFFVGVDRLVEHEPQLFDKFLYVGVTRAATYLGLTCEAGLPAQLEPLRSAFSTGNA
jgi:hypothetical protein